ncbi:hypothetical protein DR996_00485 [Vibrio owensii]|nr:hypothetical protein DR996_00485 [Vibrio owensii]
MTTPGEKVNRLIEFLLGLIFWYGLFFGAYYRFNLGASQANRCMSFIARVIKLNELWHLLKIFKAVAIFMV